MSLVAEDIVQLVSIVTDFVVIISLLVLVYQTILQRRELRYSTYDKQMSDFMTISLYLVEHPELRKMYVGKGKPKNWEKYDDDQKTLYCYFDSLLSVFERVWNACKVMEIGNLEDWDNWKNWLKQIAENPIFIDVFEDNRELYNSSFIEEVKSIISS